mmetsp:Transcript_33987/g.62945  ORF Transcript_33987/g.62945 Transcript_33987/m.62945 type:complete len:132 (-) Transcript_33987:418-813(-)
MWNCRCSDSYLSYDALGAPWTRQLSDRGNETGTIVPSRWRESDDSVHLEGAILLSSVGHKSQRPAFKSASRGAPKLRHRSRQLSKLLSSLSSVPKDPPPLSFTALPRPDQRGNGLVQHRFGAVVFTMTADG